MGFHVAENLVLFASDSNVLVGLQGSCILFCILHP
jgi:hypothetical protein